MDNNPENRARIEYAVQLCTIMPKESSFVPTLWINAEPQQMWPMVELATGLANNTFPVKPINCGNYSSANTLTQFQAIVNNDSVLQQLICAGMTTFVTSLYHVPRARRSARVTIGKLFLRYTVLGVSVERYPFDLTLVASEIAKIIKYVESGDIAPQP